MALATPSKRSDCVAQVALHKREVDLKTYDTMAAILNHTRKSIGPALAGWLSPGERGQSGGWNT